MAMRKREVAYIFHYFSYALLSNTMAIAALVAMEYLGCCLLLRTSLEYNRVGLIALMFHVVCYLLISSSVMALFFYKLTGIREKISIRKEVFFCFGVYVLVYAFMPSGPGIDFITFIVFLHIACCFYSDDEELQALPQEKSRLRMFNMR